MITKTVQFRLAAETKGALKYEEIDAEGNPTTEVIGTLYLRKAAFAGKPANVTVNVNVAA
jgi:hypothetical protein